MVKLYPYSQILPLKCLSRLSYPRGKKGQALGPIARWTPAPSSHLASLLPPPPPSQLTIMLETFTGSPLHERSSPNCSRGAGDTQALVNRPWLYLQLPLLAFHPHNPSILVTLTSVPSLSSLDPSHHSICRQCPFPFPTRQALNYPSRFRPNGTSSRKPSLTFSGKMQGEEIFLFAHQLPQGRLPSMRPETAWRNLEGTENGE